MDPIEPEQSPPALSKLFDYARGNLGITQSSSSTSSVNKTKNNLNNDNPNPQVQPSTNQTQTSGQNVAHTPRIHTGSRALQMHYTQKLKADLEEAQATVDWLQEQKADIEKNLKQAQSTITKQNHDIQTLKDDFSQV